MERQEFIKQIYEALKKHAHRYNIKVYSPIIAQAILESAFGTSELAVNANNFFGLKYKAGRCPTAIDKYVKIGSEQNPDGSYVSSVMLWCKFANLEDCVIGYLDFINNSRYNNLKGVTDPYTYLINIKADGYATSLAYVDNLMRVIKENNLTSYDDRKETNNMSEYSNSPLVVYTKISPNRTVCSNRKIDTITIHCMAGNATIESCGEMFAKASRAASSNYGIGSDGRVGLYVEEKDRSWCSSNRENDMRAITIEVANNGGAPDWPISDKAYESLVNLVTDICKRNGIKKLVWSTDKYSRVNHINGCNMTVHRDYAAKACPGNYIYNRLGQIADEVNNRLGNVKESVKVEKPVEVKPVEETGYSLKQFIRDIQGSIGAEVDGVAEPETLGKTVTLCEHRNKRHKSVKFVQKRLYTLGFTEVGDADGVAGPKFTAAVMRYQKEVVKLVHPDGIISAGKATWKKLLGMK